MDTPETQTPRGRILRAAGDLLATEGRRSVTTRAVSGAADVQPQTIYRQFGDMDGLLAAAANEGFRSYLASKSSRPRKTAPVDDLRDGWDLHVDFGLQNPALYLLMYAEPDTDRELAAAAETAAILRELVAAVARAGLLRMDAESAVAMINATGIGVVMTLIGAADGATYDALSARVREAVLRAILVEDAPGMDDVGRDVSAAAHAAGLRATLGGSGSDLTAGEALLLDELLARVSAAR